MDEQQADASPDEEKTIASRLELRMRKFRPKRDDWIPDWRDASNYANLEGSSLKQWAWEFLRRNRSYQKEFDEADWDDWDEFCRKWGIETPKPYDSANREGARGSLSAPPKWIAIHPHRVTGYHGKTGPFTPTPDKKEIFVEEGQVAVVFDLRTAWLNSKLLAAQIDSLKPHLQKILNIRNDLIDPDPGSNRQIAKLPMYLRIADAIGGQEKVLRKDIGRQFAEEGLLFKKHREEDKLHEIDDIDYGRAVEHPMEAAYGLIYEFGYLDLLVADNKK